MRQRYERPQDLVLEQAVIDALLWGNALKEAVYYKSEDPAVDYQVFDKHGDLYLLEIKGRNGLSTTHSEYLISVDKVKRGLALGRQLGGRLLLLWAWDDCMMLHEVDTAERYRSKIGGRTVQTRDKWDIENVYLIPRTSCRELNWPTGSKVSRN
jgi:hypothetical protein